MDDRIRIITDRADWRPWELENATDWIHVFTSNEIAEIEAARRFALARGMDFDTLTVESFPLPTVRERLAVALDELENNRGVYLFRGFPALGRALDDLRFIYWGIGQHLGNIRCQSYKGDYLGDVKDLRRGRLYTTNAEGTFHTDFSDVVGLFALRTAKSGGLTQIASSIAIHNEIARTRPDLLEVLYEPVNWSASRPAGMEGPAFFRMPICSMYNNKFSCLFTQTKIRRARNAATILEAMDEIERLARRDDFQLKMMFEPGDLQLINNHVCLHSRTAFEDYEEPDRRRHLLRLWVSPFNSRELHPNRSDFGDTRAGAARGGVGNEVDKRVYHSDEAMVD